MNKILVTIYVMAIDESFDMFLPINLEMSEAIELIQNTITELSNNNYVKHEKVMLINSNNKLINYSNTVKFSGLTNGCKIALI